MKYLDKFNELNHHTYNRAGKKLVELGHQDRGRKLIKKGEETREKKEREEWKEKVDKYSKYGVYELSVEKGKPAFNDRYSKFTGHFHLEFFVNIDLLRDTLLEDLEDGGEGHIPIEIYAIPIDEEIRKICASELGDEYFGTSFWAMQAYFSFSVKDGGHAIEPNNFDLSYVDVDTTFKDRGSAGKFKRLLTRIVSDPNFNYPSGYTSDYTTIYDCLDKFIGAELGLTTEYGYSIEDLSDLLKPVSINQMYKSHSDK